MLRFKRPLLPGSAVTYCRPAGCAAARCHGPAPRPTLCAACAAPAASTGYFTLQPSCFAAQRRPYVTRTRANADTDRSSLSDPRARAVRARDATAAAGAVFEDVPSPSLIPCSTTLTIGDVTLPIPDLTLHPERVSWAVPHADQALQPLSAAVMATASDDHRANAAAGSSSSSSSSAAALREQYVRALLADEQPLTIPSAPENTLFSLSDPLTKRYLRWMAQKELLGQDMCLVGDPGPAMRWLVRLYSFLTRREMRVVSLNRDVTESDLKQRREIRDGTLVYEDQSAVAAAKEGQLLVLEGLEGVERNVLPVINNLLENREMQLDNGSVLIHPARYDTLLHNLVQQRLRAGRAVNAAGLELHAVQQEAARELAAMGLVRVSERFRVVGITIPVPPYAGNPLDPPLRSRFQCLYVTAPPPPASLTARRGGGDSVLRGVPDPTASLHAAGETPPRHQRENEQQQQLAQEQQEQRLNAVLQLRMAIDAVNHSTRDFASSQPSSSARAGAAKDARGGSSGSAQLPTVGGYGLTLLTRQLQAFPDAPAGELLARHFPWTVLASQLPRGASATTSAGQEEVRRRTEQLAALIKRCELSEPLLWRAQQEDGASRPSPASSVQQMGDVLRDMMRTNRVEPAGLDAVKRYICSAAILGGARAKSTPIPVTVSRACNYVECFQNIRAVPASTPDEPLSSASPAPIVIADAVVCTNIADGGRLGSGAGTYTMAVFLGRGALRRLEEEREKGDGAAAPAKTRGRVVIAEVCPSGGTVFSTEHYHVLQTMLQLHLTRQHICLLGPTGSGKTAVVREFARALGYDDAETMHLYADMTNKDLFQRRTTDAASGSTTWSNTALVDAAIHGRLVVLDGVDKLPTGMLSSLQQILVDQDASLFDGTMLKSPQEFEMLKQKLHARSDAEMHARKIFAIHPAFRVVATARVAATAANGGGSGSDTSKDFSLTQDALTMFGIVTMPEAREETLAPVLLQVAQDELARAAAATAPGDTRTRTGRGEQAEGERAVQSLLRLRSELERLRGLDPKIPPLSLRQLLHLVRSVVHYPSGAAQSVASALLLPLMTGVTATHVAQAIAKAGFTLPTDSTRAAATSSSSSAALALAPATDTSAGAPLVREFVADGERVISLSRQYTPRERALVPYVAGFFPNAEHESIITWLGRQYAIGSSILLIGSQGVGKNKVVDAFLSRLEIPRHYIQLHRDTTVGSLTINPTVEGGTVRWEDSPLVKAVQQGHCLVVDEVDKASVEVVQVLKGLIEDREMRLGDGRQIIDPDQLAAYRRHAAHDSRHGTLHGTSPSREASQPRVAGGQQQQQPLSDGELAGTVASFDESRYIPMHPDFRLIVLANPPGFPFQGNDFFRECGDLFSAYVMRNPDELSQRLVLRAYAPAIPEPLLLGLIRSFRRLQEAFAEGTITYPFSLRELIAVVKHLSRFPQDGVYEALNNVFSFDARDANTLRTVRQVLYYYLNPLAEAGGMARLMPLRAGLPQLLKPSSELLRVPFPRATTTSSGSTGAASAASAGGFAAVLSTKVVRTPAALRQALATAEAAAPAPPAMTFWRESFPESAFRRPLRLALPTPASTATAPASAGAHARDESAGFTEWTATLCVPFLRPGTDTVLGVFPVDPSIGADRSPSTLLGVLFSRRRVDAAQRDSRGAAGAAADGKGDSGRQLILALAHMPPTSLDLNDAAATGLSEGGGAAASLTALGWPVGEVHLMDVTCLLAAGQPLCAHTAVRAADFNADAHTQALGPELLLSPVLAESAAGGQLRWPQSAALLAQQPRTRELLRQAASAAGEEAELAGTSIDASPGGAVGSERRCGRWPTVALHLPGADAAAGGHDASHSSSTAVAARERLVLVDVLAGVSSADLAVRVHRGEASAPASGSEPAVAADEHAVRDRSTALGGSHAVAAEVSSSPVQLAVEGALLPLTAAALGVPGGGSSSSSGSTDGSSTAAEGREGGEPRLFVQPALGVVCYASRNTLYVLTDGHTVAVTLPAKIDHVSFFTRALAVVSLQPVDSPQSQSPPHPARGTRSGVLKLAVTSDGTAHASFAWLPNGLDGTIVDITAPPAPSTPSSSASSKAATAATVHSPDWFARPLQPCDLRGAVLVSAAAAPSSALGSTAQSAAASGGKAPLAAHRGDIAFMMVEDASAAEGLALRVYPHESSLAPGTGAAAAVAVDSLDRAHHQLLRGDTTATLTAITVMDPRQRTTRRMAPLAAQTVPLAVSDQHGVAYAFSPESREVSVADLDVERVQRRYADWSALLNGSAANIGADAELNPDGTPASASRAKDFKMEYSTPHKKPSGSLKHGKIDDKEHHGGNTWAGGTGGTDTAGLGGVIGPYRLDKGKPVHQVSPEEKKKVPKHLVEEAKRMGKEALKERLKAIGMSEAEYESYKSLQERVRPSIAQLRTLLMGLKAAEGERAWLKGQTDGVWDDRKLVEGIVGEKNVFKRRVDTRESSPFTQTYRKRVLFVLDVSASMYRFEGVDRRLTKLLESTVMVMESFAGFDDKMDYAMIGHNGDSDCIPLVDFGAPPRNHKERMVVCQRMIAYAQYCWSGDNTVEAMRRGVELVKAARGDAYFVFVVSDANVRQYGITPQELSSIIQSDRQVQMFCIFIASIGQQSSYLQRQLPAGHGYECMRTDQLPHILRQIFTSVNLL